VQLVRKIEFFKLDGKAKKAFYTKEKVVYSEEDEHVKCELETKNFDYKIPVPN